MSYSLPLSDIFPVSVFISPAAVPGPSFNQALIVGPSTTIPSIGASSRTRLYQSTSQMTADGFASNAPEFLAAEVYFGQTPAPTNLWVGRQDLTAIQTIAIGAVAGTGYTAGDIVTVVQSGGSGGQVKITAVNSGVPTAVAIIAGSQGTGYSTASNLATTGGTGTGLEINITAIGETPAQAVEACRLQNPSWYICLFVGTATDSDHEAIAAFIEGASPASVYFVTASGATVPNGASSSLPGVLQAAKYNRTLSEYSTTQTGAYPNNAFAAAAPAGYAMGANNGAAGSYFDLNNKSLSGVVPEPLTPTQILAIRGASDRSTTGLNCNLIVPYQGGAYNLFQPGIMASGRWFDEVLQIDMLVSDIQSSLMALFVSVGALPITNGGVAQVKTVIAGACERSKTRGFVAPSGTWQGVAVGTGSAAIAPGDALPNGYYLYAPPVSSLSQAQKSARQMPPVTVLLVESGSGHSLAVSVNVQQ